MSNPSTSSSSAAFDDADLASPAAGHEMTDPDAHGLFEGEQMLNDPRFKHVIEHIDGEGGKFDIEGIEERRRQREEKLKNDPAARAAQEKRLEEASKMPDIISYGFCKLVYDFLEALQKRFPKRKMLTRTVEYYWKLCERCPVMPFMKFQDLVKNCEEVKENVFEEWTDENEEIIKSELCRNPVFKMAKIHRVWVPELDEDTKTKIRAYVSRLVQITKLISQFNPKLRSLINAISMDSLNAVKGKDKRNINVADLLGELEERIMGDSDLLDEIVELAQEQL